MPRLLLASLLVLAGCSAERSLRTPDGKTRTYRLHVPQKRATPTPLVIMLHGGGGNAEGTQANMNLDPIADEEGFIVVYPNGTGKKLLGKLFATWNSDEQCCGDAQKNGVDDVGFISLLIDTLVKEQQVDPKRVYATGLSNGGDMTHRLGCELSEKVAAIAPMGPPLIIGSCAPARPVPVMLVTGTEDHCASYADVPTCGGCWSRALEESGLGSAGAEDTFTDCMGLATQAEKWRGFNGCGATSRVTLEKGAVRCDTFDEGCAAPVSACTVSGGGHTVPGSSYGCDQSKTWCKAYVDAVGPINSDISLREVWEFFKGHSLP